MARYKRVRNIVETDKSTRPADICTKKEDDPLGSAKYSWLCKPTQAKTTFRKGLQYGDLPGLCSHLVAGTQESARDVIYSYSNLRNLHSLTPN